MTMTTPLQEAVANLLRVLDECLYTNDHCGLEVDKEDEAEVTAAIDAARTALAAPAPTAPSKRGPISPEELKAILDNGIAAAKRTNKDTTK